MALDPVEITGSLAIGTGLGGAIADTVNPRLQSFKNSQWAAHQDVPLAPGEAADIAAEDVAQYAAMATEATYSGVDGARFQNLYNVTLTAPGMGELLTMLRRNTIGVPQFTHGLRKAKLETEWDGALADLANVYIGLGDIAYAVVRGILPAPPYVPVAPPAHGDKVPRYPQVPLDPEALAGKLGYSPQMLEIMVGRSGLSMAPGLAAQAYFRNIIGPNDFLMAVAEGDLRTEWADAMREVSRQILTSGEYVEGHLRGWTTQQQMYAGTAQHGMTQADTDLLFDISGRPTSIRQVYVGLSRGAHFPAQYTDVPSPFREALQQSNIRPEWASIAYENRYSLPSAFVVRALLTDGAIDAARGTTILENSGWPPDLAAIVATHYAGGTAAAADPHVTKAESRLWTTMQTSYISGEVVAGDLGAGFTALGVPAAARTQIVSLWDEARALERKQLTPTQIKKAVAEGVTNPATGAAWTHTEAVARLISMGYSTNDAATFLAL